MTSGDARVVVLGAGFAGLRAVRRLGRAGVPVLWIDRHNYHCFLPLLYQVATAGLEPQQIAYPIRHLLHHLPTVDYRMAEIVAADPAARTLTSADGTRIGYEYLLVCTGGAAEDFGIPGVREHAQRLYDLDDARRLRNHVLETLEQAAVTTDERTRATLLTFVIVGGGPTGLELAGALGEFRRHVVPADYRTFPPDALRVVLLEAGPALLAPYPESLRNRARADVERFGVEVRTGTAVARVDAEGVELASGERIAAHTVVWAAGIRAGEVTARLGLPVGRSGRLMVEPTLDVSGHRGIFAAGDVALVRGQERLPQVAQVAIQQGRHAADNIQHACEGRTLVPFSYVDKGSMATIGRQRAVGIIGRVRVRGVFGWWVWLLVHLVMLIGFRNRLVVLVNWAWNYVTYDRGLRAIIGGRAPAPR